MTSLTSSRDKRSEVFKFTCFKLIKYLCKIPKSSKILGLVLIYPKTNIDYFDRVEKLLSAKCKFSNILDSSWDNFNSMSYAVNIHIRIKFSDVYKFSFLYIQWHVFLSWMCDLS